MDALKGIKVVDFTWMVAGPWITTCLAGYGATVVRIESNKRPDYLRQSGNYMDNIPGVNRSGSFNFYNPNKYSIAIDLGSPKGREVAKKLVVWADVVVENFRAGVMERWGLGYEDLKAIKPDIVMMRSSNQGQTGPSAKHPGYGVQLMALTGFCHFTGWPDGEPMPLPVAYTDQVAPLLAVTALLAALDYRRRTGKGQLLDLSQLETGIHLLSSAILNYVVNGEEGSRIGNSCSYAAPHAVYRCKGDDRWCAIAVFTDAEWDAFCQVIGNPEWTRDSKFATLLGRKRNEEELNSLVEAWTANLTAEQVMDSMQVAGVAAGVAKNAAEICQDPQLKLRDHLLILEHREIGLFPHRGQSSKLSKTPAKSLMPSPCLGEHTELVCTKMLGMSKEEFATLLAEGVFE